MIVIVAALGAVGSFLGVIVDVLPAIDLLEKWFGQELSTNVIGAICSAAAGDIIIAIMYLPWSRLVGSTPNSPAARRLATFIESLDRLIKRGDEYAASKYGYGKIDKWEYKVRKHLETCESVSVEDFLHCFRSANNATDLDSEVFATCLKHLRSVRAGLSEKDFDEPASESTASSNIHPA